MQRQLAEEEFERELDCIAIFGQRNNELSDPERQEGEF